MRNSSCCVFCTHKLGPFFMFVCRNRYAQSTYIVDDCGTRCKFENRGFHRLLRVLCPRRVPVYRRVFRPFFLNDAPSGIQRMERKRNSRTSRAPLHPPETCFTCKLGRLALQITRIFSRYDL